MLQDGRTKDVFRELDGFLVLMSVLSTIQNRSDSLVVEPEEQVLAEVIQSTRLVFMIASEAMHEYPENDEYFRVSDFLRCAVIDVLTCVQESRRIRAIGRCHAWPRI